MNNNALEFLKINASFPPDNYLDKYHLKEIQMNLFDEPYEGIDSRANSIRSSAAMIFYTIGKSEIIIDEKNTQTSNMNTNYQQ